MFTNFSTLRILSCLLFFSCSVCGEQFPEVSEAEEAFCKAKIQAREAAYKEYSVYLSDLQHSFASEMKQSFNLHCAGGGGQMHGKIKQLNLDFYADRRATIAEARALHLLVLEKYVEAINGDERLRPFLKTYPFTHDQIKISLVFRGVNGEHADGSVRRASTALVPDMTSQARKHHLFYDAEDPTTMGIIELLEEPYEEAVRQNALAPVENPAVHPVTAKEEAIDQLLLGLRKQMYEKHGLECSSIGGDMQGRIDSVGAKFVAFHQATQEEARWLLLDIAQSFVTAVNEQPELRPYFHDELFSADRLRLRLSFKSKKTYLSYSNGTMESVLLEDGQITYFREITSEESKHMLSFPSLVPVYAEESYEEALKIVENTLPVKKRHKIFSMWLNFL